MEVAKESGGGACDGVCGDQSFTLDAYQKAALGGRGDQGIESRTELLGCWRLGLDRILMEIGGILLPVIPDCIIRQCWIERKLPLKKISGALRLSATLDDKSAVAEYYDILVRRLINICITLRRNRRKFPPHAFLGYSYQIHFLPFIFIFNNNN